MITTPKVHHYRAKAPLKISDVLEELNIEIEEQQKLFTLGAIYRNGKRQRENISLLTNDLLRIHQHPKKFLTYPESWVPTIVYEDEDITVIDKPGGLPTHPTLDNYLENAQMICQTLWKRPVYVTHRLDVATSGLLIFAKTLGAQKGVNRMFRDRKVKKIYRGIVDRNVDEGHYTHYLNPTSHSPKEIAAEHREGWQDCRLWVRHLDRRATHLELDLETGRTHQIRAQMAFLGAPICGDHLYGSKSAFEMDKKFVHERIALECYYLSITLRSRTLGISRPSTLVAPLNT